MSELGMGAMLHILGGGSQKKPSDYFGRKIVGATFDDKELRLTFSDGVTISLYDDGQSCCESRYFTSDDEVRDLVGRTLVDIGGGTAKAPAGDECHDMDFVDVKTETGVTFSFCAHVEHNGYYGGFGWNLVEVEK